MQKDNEEDNFQKVYRYVKKKHVAYDAKRDKALEPFCFAWMNSYTAQGRTPTNMNIENTLSGADICFSLPVKHPCLISSAAKRTPIYVLSEGDNAQKKPEVMMAIVDALNKNKDKTGLPQKYNWRLLPRKDNLGFCAVLELNHELHLSAKIKDPDTEPFYNLLCTVKLFCEQYCDMNCDRKEQLFPLARYEILGAMEKKKNLKKIRITIPIPPFMKPEDLQVLFNGFCHNWVRLSTNATCAFIPVDYNPEADPNLNEKLQKLKDDSKHLNTTPKTMLVSVDGAHGVDRSDLPDCPNSKSAYDYLIEAFTSYKIDFVDITVLKKIRLKAYSLKPSDDMIQNCNEGLCAKVPDGPNGQKIFNNVISSAQMASKFPTCPRAEWSVRAGMIICVINDITPEDVEKFSAICKQYPSKVTLNGNKLVILDQLLREDELMTIGDLIADNTRANSNVAELLKSHN